jgi:TolB protein
MRPLRSLAIVAAVAALAGGAEATPARDAAAKPSLLVYASLTKEPLGSLGDLFVMRSDGKGSRPLRILNAPDTGDETSPAWSPDGRRIAFSAGLPLIHASAIQLSPYDAAIAVVDAAGGRARLLTGPAPGVPAPVIDDSPSWSPDGRSIAFVRTDEYGGLPGLGIYVMRADGKGLRQIVDRAGIRAVDWSPDGRSLAFVTWFRPTRVGTVDLGTGVVKEFRTPGPMDVSWSPDGRYLALASDGGVSVVTTTGKLVRRVFDRCCATHVSWSPDGQRIAFSAGFGKSYREAVYVVDADGSHLKRIAGGESSYAPDWRPE